MASSYPVQTRAVDPYASYNSNVVNQLTGIVTRGSNALDFYNSLQVIPDSTSAIDHVEVLPGIIYKDDMLIEITSSFRLDFDDLNSYIGVTSSPISSIDGMYYVVLEYTYVKSRPAPIAYIKILIPTQTPGFRAGNIPSLFFLKAVEISGGSITNMWDYDPDYPDTRREYLRHYAGTEVGLPPHDPARDQSRVAYNPNDDQFYLGYSDRWGAIGGTTFQVDDGGFGTGDLVYLTPAGSLQVAQGSFAAMTADGVVINSDPISPTTVQVTGPVRNVRAEAGITLAVGDLLYTSTITPGTVTNVKSTPFWQFAGRVMELTDSTSANILFHRGEPSGIEGVELGIYQLDTLSTWGGGGGGGNPVYEDISISTFDGEKAVVTLWDSVKKKIQPVNIEYVDSNALRIYMPDGYAATLEALVLGPPASTVPSSTLDKVVDTLNAVVDWSWDGANWYGDIDVSSIDLSEGSVVMVYNTSNEEIIAQEIHFTTPTTLRIWMPINTETLKVVAVGPSSSPTLVTTMTAILSAGGSWTTDGPLYYQDIPISSLGTDDVVFDIKDDATGERIDHTDASIPIPGTLRIWMPDSTHDLIVTVLG